MIRTLAQLVLERCQHHYEFFAGFSPAPAPDAELLAAIIEAADATGELTVTRSVDRSYNAGRSFCSLTRHFLVEEGTGRRITAEVRHSTYANDERSEDWSTELRVRDVEGDIVCTTLERHMASELSTGASSR